MPPASQEPVLRSWRARLSALGRKAAGVPVWFGVAVTVVCLVVKEFYPFSHFPMYSKNAPSTFCLYVTGADDGVLFTLPEFGKLSSVLKKMFNTKIQKYKADGRIKRYDEMTDEQYQAVGGEILQWLLEERRKFGKPPLPGKVSLFREEYVLTDDRVVKETFKLAEVPGGGAS